MGASGKMLFTATQWQELQRQTMIYYKYIIASIPVPPQLLLPLSTQSNRVSMGLRFSSGSDPEPWRCRRTDGKKWRCSKDVAPDHTYCERHSHKTRSRSRKPVEHPLLPSADTKNHNNFNNPIIQPNINSSNEQTSDWLLKSGVIDWSQFRQSPRGGTIKCDYEEHKSFLDHNTSYLNDGWSRIGSGDDCALTLSMQSGGNGIEFESFQTAVGMLDDERGGSQHQWLDQGSWLGGPLGEALVDSPAYTSPNVSSSFH